MHESILRLKAEYRCIRCSLPKSNQSGNLLGLTWGDSSAVARKIYWLDGAKRKSETYWFNRGVESSIDSLCRAG